MVVILPPATPRAAYETAQLDAAIAVTRAQARRDLILVESAMSRVRSLPQLITLTRFAERLRSQLGAL